MRYTAAADGSWKKTDTAVMTRDASGRLATTTTGTRTEKWGYNDIGHTIAYTDIRGGAPANKLVITYQYDSFGNWISSMTYRCTEAKGKPTVYQPLSARYRILTYDMPPKKEPDKPQAGQGVYPSDASREQVFGPVRRGKLTESLLDIPKKGKPAMSKPVTSRVASYDPYGNLLEATSFTETGAFQARLRWCNVYDAQGRLLERLTSDANGTSVRSVFLHDARGQFVAESMYDTLNGLAADRQISAKAFTPPRGGPVTREDYVYVYDIKGRLTQMRSKKDNAKVDYAYDEKGNVLRETYYAQGKEEKRLRHVYVYDKYGNWTKHVIYAKQGPKRDDAERLVSRDTRELTYYPPAAR